MSGRSKSLYLRDWEPQGVDGGRVERVEPVRLSNLDPKSAADQLQGSLDWRSPQCLG